VTYEIIILKTNEVYQGYYFTDIHIKKIYIITNHNVAFEVIVFFSLLIIMLVLFFIISLKEMLT